MRFIGDCHGKFNAYLEIVKDCPESIQVGDFGAGFVPLPDVNKDHFFIRGNHDNPTICKTSRNWIEDGSQIGNMFFVGGLDYLDLEI